MLKAPKRAGPHALLALAIGAGCGPAEVKGGTVPTEPTLGPFELCLNEFVADNVSGWSDGNGAFPDWVELHNPGDASVALDGWYLTDDPEDPWKHELRGLSIDAGGFLVLVADGQPELGPEHLAFGLSREGEALGLFREDGAGELLTFGPVAEDFAWARASDCCVDVETCTEIRWLGSPGFSNAG